MREFPDESVVEAVRAVCGDAPVTLAVLYGSRARGDATAASDVDVAVAFDESLSSEERTGARLGLIERLSTRLGTDEVDVVPLAETPPELRREICADGVVIQGTSAGFEAYCDEIPREETSDDRLGEFDELLAEVDRVV